MTEATPPTPERCQRGRCLNEANHDGKCLHDDGTATYSDKRAAWKKTACEMISHRLGKVGRPSKLSRELTISEAAERCGVSRQSLGSWLKKKLDAQDAAKDDHEDPQAEEKAKAKKLREAIHTYEKSAAWAGKAAAPDRWAALADNTEARSRVLGLAKVALEQLAKTIATAAPTLDTTERKTTLLASLVPLTDALLDTAKQLAQPAPEKSPAVQEGAAQAA